MAVDTVSIESPLLLLTQPGRDEMAELGVPEPSANLFTRIIRDPTAPDRPMRERHCTEMLCAALMNCPHLRAAVLRWMARAAGQPEEMIDELDWRFDTERPTLGGKRDDLRVEGRRTTDDGDERVEVLWTVEVKVQAAIHESTDATRQEDDQPAADDADEDDPEAHGDAGPADTDPAADVRRVSQLLNYDAWLARQDAPHKGGFVLAIPNHQANLPAGLTCRWACLTWTGLGQAIADALAADLLPPAEKPLARHVLGFIRQHLWRSSEMAETRLNFDHVALLRAFAAIGRECNDIVNELAASLREVFEESGLGLQDIKTENVLFGQRQWSVVYGKLIMGTAKAVLAYAGLSWRKMQVWVESSRGNTYKDQITEATAAALARLQARNPGWMKGEDEWHNLVIMKPMAELLGADDQAEAVRRFVADALADLEAVEIDRVIREACEVP